MGNFFCCKCKSVEKKSFKEENADDPFFTNDDLRCSSKEASYEHSYVAFYNEKNFPVNMSRSSTIDKSQGKISKEHFEEIKIIGRGTFGEVLLVRKKSNNKLYAMKILKKSVVKNKNQEKHTKTERHLLEKIEHPFLVSLLYAFQDDVKLYLVTEFMQGGELFYHLRKAKCFREDKAKFYIAEIVLALEYLHDHNTIYRDLKPENILLDKDGHIRLTDFGLSKIILPKSNKKALTICGTPEYLAPEILSGKGYDKTVDWWSLGALTYEMLCGYSPFKDNKSNEKLDMEVYTTPVYMHSHFSADAKSFIQALLTVDPKKRLGSGPNGTKNVKNHPFFQEIDFMAFMGKNVNPPFIPEISFEEDLRNFDKIFTEQNIIASESDNMNNISPRSPCQFPGFTYDKEKYSFGDAEKEISLI